jgi:quercetin dioxygenase-like cupin family protein
VGYSVKITRIEETTTFENVHLVEAKQIYDTENATVIHMSLQPGQSLKKHTTPVDVFFYILEGEGTVEIGEEKQEVQKQDVQRKEIQSVIANNKFCNYNFTLFIKNKKCKIHFIIIY